MSINTFLHSTSGVRDFFQVQNAGQNKQHTLGRSPRRGLRNKVGGLFVRIHFYAHFLTGAGRGPDPVWSCNRETFGVLELVTAFTFYTRGARFGDFLFRMETLLKIKNDHTPLFLIRPAVAVAISEQTTLSKERIEEILNMKSGANVSQRIWKLRKKPIRKLEKSIRKFLEK